MYGWVNEFITVLATLQSAPFLHKRRLDLWLLLFVTKTFAVVQDMNYCDSARYVTYVSATNI